ncbi:MAG: hypothetical protein A3K19_20220 [Lentisphaerae bacterium RIFOXYB12_FULL_65_16]|nr:MAG: hypothetical protein A3K19_20220 [Lentisphaerae bacterium RIFOXYB12_FULL_65_16]
MAQIRDQNVHACALGDPGRAFPNRPADGLIGRYRTDGVVTFDRQPRQPWEFMATGTGTTGIAVGAGRDLRLQVNHAGAVDGWGVQHALGVLHIDGSGQPLVENRGFKMMHDLRRSVITIEVDTGTGAVRAEVRAHKELDVIRIDLFDARPQPGDLGIRIESDHPHVTDVLPDHLRLSWHENRASIVRDSWLWSGVSDPEKLPDPLRGRRFGLAVAVETDLHDAGWRDDLFAASRVRDENSMAKADGAPPKGRTTIWLTGVSEQCGETAWRDEVLRRIKAARDLSHDEFVASHERWWSEFWARSCFEPRDPGGRFTCQRASFDLYRYYMACCSSPARPWPERFQNTLFAYSLNQRNWSVLDIWGVETYQTLYAAVRTGDQEPVRDRILYRDRLRRVLAAHCAARFGHPGVIAAYESSIWGSYFFWNGKPTHYTERDSPYLRYTWQGNLWLLLLMWEHCALYPDDTEAEAILRRSASETLEFFRHHYPRVESGKRVFYPSEAGETWCGVTDSAELVSALRAVLPRLAAMGRERGWDARLADACQALLAETPPVPRGRFISDPDGHERPVVEPGDDLVPAAGFERCESTWLPWANRFCYRLNAQHCELFSLWPGKLTSGDADLEAAALRAYQNRRWQHYHDGWNLDVVFAANLGLTDEVATWFDHHFDHTHVFPCGLAQEASPKEAGTGGAITVYPSLQGLGTSVIPVIDQLIADHPDGIGILPCWPLDVGVHFVLHHPLAGRVEVNFEPATRLTVKTRREVRIVVPDALRGLLCQALG